MRRTDLSLDDEIAEVERRLAHHRAELRLFAAELRSRVSVRSALPVAVVTALAVGFAASRFARRSPAPSPIRTGSRGTRFIGAVAAVLLPRLVRPLQHAVATWITQRLHRSARGERFRDDA